jgi:glycine oxidase
MRRSTAADVDRRGAGDRRRADRAGLRLAGRRRGATVAVVDEALGSGASHVAAGMLAPVSEVAYGEEDLLALTSPPPGGGRRSRRSSRPPPDVDVGYQQLGTLLVGLDRDDVEALDELHRFQLELGLDARRLRSRECRQHEPLLSPRVRGGVLAGDDHQVEPRRVPPRCGRRRPRPGSPRRPSGSPAVTHDGGGRGSPACGWPRADVRGGQVVLAAGCWSGQLDGLPPRWRSRSGR